MSRSSEMTAALFRQNEIILDRMRPLQDDYIRMIMRLAYLVSIAPRQAPNQNYEFNQRPCQK
jgi:hypothetical protein